MSSELPTYTTDDGGAQITLKKIGVGAALTSDFHPKFLLVMCICAYDIVI